MRNGAVLSIISCPNCKYPHVAKISEVLNFISEAKANLKLAKPTSQP